MIKRNDENRAVITGLGIKSPAGCDIETFWARVQSGKATARKITNFDASALTVRFAGEVDDEALAIENYANSKEVRRWDRFTQLGVAAAVDAFKDSGLEGTDFDVNRAAVVTGTGVGGILTLEEQWTIYQEKGPRAVSPFFVPSMMANAIAGHASIICGFAGVNINLTTACAAGTHAIGEAARLIWDGTADIVLSGGAEAGVTPLVVSAFARMGALSTRNDDPTLASRPFDADRDGFVIAEGAGFVIMESLAHAKARGANILAEVVGYGRSGDAHHITAPLPDGSGAARSMQMALDTAGINPSDVKHINAHGTSTPLNDSGETKAMHHIFGDSVPPVSGTKGVTGHLIAAAGAAEAIISTLTIRDKVMPPTANFEKPGDDIDLDIVHGEPREYDGGIVLSNSFGFGGHNASVLISPVVP
ncbi:MAG TPA: beta-ketoacyl-ACP synthase II [Acidimicrobiia bacterium]|nr:beta-ketoacyl-ACP synthase II [Acidimicrobiia bacterium]